MGWEALDEATLTIRPQVVGIFFRPVTPGRFMLRLRASHGVITAEQLELLGEADRSLRLSTAAADITTRQEPALPGGCGMLKEHAAGCWTPWSGSGLTSRQIRPLTTPATSRQTLLGRDRPEEIRSDTRPLVQAIQVACSAPMARRNLPPQVQTWPSAVLRQASSPQTTWPSGPAHHDGRLGFHRDGGGLLLPPARNELASPLGSGWRGRPAMPDFALADAAPFRAGAATAKLRQQEPA